MDEKEIQRMEKFINEHPPAKVVGFNTTRNEFVVSSVFTKMKEGGQVSSYTRQETVRASRNAIMKWLGYD